VLFGIKIQWQTTHSELTAYSMELKIEDTDYGF